MSPEQFESLKKRLRLFGLPKTYVNRVINELNDHIEDIVTTERQRGLTEVDARASAEEQIGAEDYLFHNIVRTARRGKALGRHPTLSFVVLPVLTFCLVPAFAIFLLTQVILPLLGPDDSTDKLYISVVTGGFWFVKYALPFLLAGIFCYVARMALCGYRWGTTAVLIGTLTNLLAYLNISFTPQRQIQLGLVLPPSMPVVRDNIFALLIPVFSLALFGAFYWLNGYLDDRRSHV